MECIQEIGNEPSAKYHEVTEGVQDQPWTYQKTQDIISVTNQVAEKVIIERSL